MPLPVPFCGDSTDRGAGLSCTEAWEDADEVVDEAGDDAAQTHTRTITQASTAQHNVVSGQKG
jgi:hypothetical protein